MPYISNKDKLRFLETLSAFDADVDRDGISCGDFNYVITMMCQKYIDRHGSSYNTLSDVIKTLECAKLEFYRRLLVPYEDGKAVQNGDVYYRAEKYNVFDKRNEVK